MHRVHKRALAKCRSKIVSDLTSESEFWDKLAEQEIFTAIMLEVIQAITVRPDKVRRLLDDLIRRGPTAYVKFLYCLDNSGHRHLADSIRDTEKEICNPNETVIYERRDRPAHQPTDSSNHGDRHLHPSASAESLSQHNLSNQSYNSHSLPNISSSGGVVTSPSDESASNHGNTSLSQQDNSTITDDVRMENDTDESTLSSQDSATSLQDTERKSTSIVSEKAKSYKMSSTPRGFVLIINNEFFPNGIHRTGAQQDGEMLTRLFTDLGFEVNMMKDQTAYEIEEALLRFSQLETLHQVDSLVVVLMSHGNNENIYGVDCQKRDIMSLVKFFDRDRCPAMKNKPKMFIVNACRGDMVDHNVRLGGTQPCFDRIHSDSIPTSLDRQPPANSDFVIAYSTFPGYVSLRHEQQGSWFIKNLFEVFRDHSTGEHVMDMLTQVNDKVASMSEEEEVEYSQTPAPTTTLRCKWYLNPIQR